MCLVIGAGDGLGASVARAFAREGLSVCVTRRPRHTEAIDKLAEAIRAEGGKAYAFGLDARVEADVAALVERIEREIGPIEVLVFNIGANVRFPVVETTTQVYSKVWEMAALAGFLTSREAARAMIERGRGTILFTGATASLRGGAGFSGFRRGEACAARAGAESGARTGAEGRACRPYRHRRRDRRRLHPRPVAGRRRKTGAGGDSRPTRSPGTTSGCIARSAAPGLSKWTCGRGRKRGDERDDRVHIRFRQPQRLSRLSRAAADPRANGGSARHQPCLLGGIFKATGNLAPAIAFAADQGQVRVRDAGDAPFHRQARNSTSSVSTRIFRSTR